MPASLQGPTLQCQWTCPDDVTPGMRVLVVEWLMLAADMLQLDPEWRTLHRAVLLLDLTMHRQPVGRDRLHALAVAVLCLACKYEGILLSKPQAACLTNGKCSVREIDAMEWHAFQSIEFRAGWTTTWEWTRELATRRKAALTDAEWYRLDHSLLQPSRLSRSAAAQRILQPQALEAHRLLKKRYPGVWKPPRPPSLSSRAPMMPACADASRPCPRGTAVG